jgi:hypothetical protein
MTARALILLLLLAATPLGAATRLYFPATTAAGVSPAADSGWEDATEIERRELAHVKNSSSITIGQVVDIIVDSGDQDLDRQYVSNPMNAGIVFTTAVTTVRLVVMTREYAATDDVTMCIIGIRVANEAGTPQATLLATANYGPVAEFVNNVTHRNKQCADGDTVTSTYTTAAGDRLVVEISYQTDGADTSPQASAKWGENATDCAENESNTANCAGWIEFSNTITFQAAASRRVMVIQ